MSKLNDIPASIKTLYDSQNPTDINGIRADFKLFKIIDANFIENSHFGKNRLSLPDVFYLIILVLSGFLFLIEIIFGSKALNKVIFDLFLFLPVSYLVAFPLKEIFRVLAFSLLGTMQIVLSLNQKVELRCSAAIFSCNHKLALLIALPLILTNILLVSLYFLPGSHHFILTGSLLALNAFALSDLALINESILLEPQNYYTYYTPQKEMHIFTKMS